MPKKPDVHDFVLRERVQAHPATDTWMRGDRYGEVVKLTPTAVHVKMDRSKRIIRFHPKNIEHLQSNPRGVTRLTRFEAKHILEDDLEIPRGEDFHALPSDTVHWLGEHAKEQKFRHRKGAPGSRTRMFYAHLQRVAYGSRKDKYERLARNPKKHIRVTPVRKNPFKSRNPTGLRSPHKQPKRWIISAAVEGKRLIYALAIGGHAFTDKLSEARMYYSKSAALKDAKRVLNQLPLNVKWVRVDKY